MLAFPLPTCITGPVPLGPVQSRFEIVVLAAGRHREGRRTTRLIDAASGPLPVLHAARSFLLTSSKAKHGGTQNPSSVTGVA